MRTLRFDDPIDAVSFRMPDDTQLQVRSGAPGSSWQDLEIEEEFDPLLQESNLVLFSAPTHAIIVRGNSAAYEVHPIRIANDLPHYAVASQVTLGTPRILSRTQWGADETYLFTKASSSQSSEPDLVDRQEESAPAARVKKCQEDQVNYPDDFAVSRTVTIDRNGGTYRWPQRYSPAVKLFVVHHTAMKVAGDARLPYERMRALYAYHANTLDWGDIGYHYVIDENGQIYEGRAGGEKVVGGHAYCANVGTIGIALMGNLELEKPPQAQMKSLQWLLADLADKYDVDLDERATFHGVAMDPIVGHRTLVSTACPGYYLYQTLNQVRRNVIAGDIDRSIRFPQGKTGLPVASDERTVSRPLQAIGSTEITGPPGGQTRLTMLYRAPQSQRSRERIAEVERSNPRIGLWQDLGDGNEFRVRYELLLPQSMRKDETVVLSLRIQFPFDADTYTLEIGDVTYTLNATGRRRGVTSNIIRTPAAQRESATPQQSVARSRPTRTSDSNEGSVAQRNIRIRLGFAGETATITSNRGLTLRDNDASHARVELKNEENSCVAYEAGKAIGRGVIRLTPRDEIATISSWASDTNRFRGVIECRVVDGILVLINDVSLEDYIAGLAEEPDTEPYEKQRAFAIAARSYAAFYTEPGNIKFPGMPYQGDDSAARFQAYGGVVFKQRNLQWVRAVESTAGLVVKKGGTVVKTPYFSSDDGRTRSPAENGWQNFPFEEVFTSKPDPWCSGMPLWGHGVGMSGCGAEGQANEGKTAEAILEYYYPGTELMTLDSR